MNGIRLIAVGVLTFSAVLAWAGTLGAQTPMRDLSPLPPEVADEVLAFYNRPETVRITGEARIAADSELAGDLAVLGGPLVVEGRVRGNVVVLNGEARLAPGAEIHGDLLVVGGAVTGLEEAMVTGTAVAYAEALRFRAERGILVKSSPPPDPELTAGRDFAFGRTDLTLAARRGYNRVEGLPIAIGPRFEIRGSHPIRLEAHLIYRTGTGFDIDAADLGYALRLEQELGGRRGVRLGASLHSVVEPIETWGLTDTENSLATFLLRRDYRDYYEREGWSAYLRLAPSGRAYDAALIYRDERHASVPTLEPWTPFGSREWRPQPRMAEGTLRTLSGRLVYDTRNEGIDPAAGWFVQAEIEGGLGGSGEWGGLVPVPPPCEECEEVADRAGARFAAIHLDARRYARLGPDSRLNVRALVSSSLDDRPLPPQRQRTLGGEGSLPGYEPFRFDCGARASFVGPDGFLPFYGCDRIALVQLEYHRAFPFARGWGRRLGWDMDLGEIPGWVIFFDAGRAWTERTARVVRGTGQEDFAADAGMGLRLGKLGLYWAVPLSGSDRGVNFFVRIGPRL